jgi:hypothetical protein
VPEKANNQNKIEGAVGNSASDERGSQELLAPVSLMVLNIGGKDNGKGGILTVSDHPTGQVKPSLDQTASYPRHNFEQHKLSRRKRPRNPVGLQTVSETLESTNDHPIEQVKPPDTELPKT